MPPGGVHPIAYADGIEELGKAASSDAPEVGVELRERTRRLGLKCDYDLELKAKLLISTVRIGNTGLGRGSVRCWTVATAL